MPKHLEAILKTDPPPFADSAAQCNLGGLGPLLWDHLEVLEAEAGWRSLAYSKESNDLFE
jgi:hypothetical protein